MSYGQPPGGEQEDPAGYGQPAYALAGAPPPRYRGWGIAANVCGILFNLILGFPAALIGQRYGKKVTELWARGDVPAAISASRKARAWLLAATLLDGLGLILTVVVIAAAASSAGNFSKPSAVAASIKTQLQHRISNSSSQYYQPGVTVTSVVCTPSGTNTDRCVDKFSNGQTGTETAVISGNGASYSTR